MAELSAGSVGESPGVNTTSSETPQLQDRLINPPPINTAKPPTSTRLKKRLFSPIRNILGERESLANPSAPSQEIVPTQSPGNAPSSVPQTLISPGEDIDFKDEAVSSARKVDICDKTILCIKIVKGVVDLAEVALPSRVGDILDALIDVLGVLKQIIENKEAWKELILTIDDHRKRFNGQIQRLGQENVERDLNSPLLEPLGRYSDTLRGLAIQAIADSSLVCRAMPADSFWRKSRKFISRYKAAESDKERITEYHERLKAAMGDLMQSLTMFTAVEARETNLAVYRVEPVVHDIKKQVDMIAEKIVAPSVSKRKVKAKAPPQVTPFYVRREAEWELMTHHLVTSDIPGQKIFAITGMGGCGKTQLVADFLQQNKDTFPIVVYVDAISEASIKADLQTWAQSLGDGHEQDEWDDGLRLLADITLEGRRAYILDNADDTKPVLPKFLPDSDAVTTTTIITSRNRFVGKLAKTFHLQMGGMTEDEALSTLIKAANRQDPIPSEELKSAHVLIQEMGGLALALVQAGAYCDSISSKYSFNQYLSLFHSERAALLEDDEFFSLDKYERGVYTTLNVSYKVMPPSTREFFHLTSYFRYSDIPVAMLAAAAKQHFEDPKLLLPRPKGHERPISRLPVILCKDGHWDQIQTGKFIRTLHSFSLVSTTVIEDSLFLRYHPLVQAWARDKRSSDAQDYRTMAMQITTSCCTHSNITIYRYILPHITTVLEEDWSSMHVNNQTAFGVVLLEVGRYSDAGMLFEQSLKSLRQLSDNETEETLWVTAQLAKVYGCQGRHDKAETLHLEVLEKCTKLLRSDHPDVIQAAANLAATYHEQGRLAEAEKLKLEVLEKRTKLLGSDHPDVIEAAANLAGTYHEQGRLAEAEKLELEVLEKRTKLLGSDHPDVIQAAANLAATYHKQGRLAEAEKLKLEVLEKRTKLLGSDHPDVIEAAAHLAGTYHEQGRLAEAEKLDLEVLEKCTKLLGSDHPDVIRAAANLAATYHEQGRLAEAEKLKLEVLEKRTKLLGSDHPDVIRAAANLAATYHEQGRLAEAEKLKLEVLEKRTKLLGSDHPDVIQAAANLAGTYYEQGRLAEAEKLELEVLEKRTKLLGSDHPDVIRAAANLAGTYHEQGRLAEAEKLKLEVLEKRTNLLGADHPDTLLDFANLAATYRSQGWLDEAE